MSIFPDTFNKRFIEYGLANPSGLFLDVGAAFGVTTLPLVNQGCKIVACDIEPRHLEIIKQNVEPQHLSCLTLDSRHLPDTLTFDENSFDAIMISMVFHFLPPMKVKKALKNVFQWLKVQGKLFVTVSSPYQGTLKKFIPLYEERKRHHSSAPGIIEDISIYVGERAKDLPKFNNVFDISDLEALFKNAGFMIEDASYFTRESLPSDIQLAGREYTGIIGIKPLAETLSAL